MTLVYLAPKPQWNHSKWFKYAIRIFPPILLWDLIKYGANKWLGVWISKLVNQAQNKFFTRDKASEDRNAVHLEVIDDKEILEPKNEDFKVIKVSELNTEELVCQKHKIVTHDGAHLDTLEVQHITQINSPRQDQKYIINFIGNNACYEHNIAHIKQLASLYKTNVVGFNLRGVLKSTGKAQSKDDLVTDGIAQVQRLLDLGVSPQNITLKGFSLGGAIATLVAQYFHQQKKPINIFNDRSFSSLSHFLIGHIRLKKKDGKPIGHQESRQGILLGWLAKPIIKFALALTKWEINAGSAFKKIPEQYKEYMVIRSPKDLRKERCDDNIIPYYASIHKALTSERRAKKAKLDKKIKNIDIQMKNPTLAAKPTLPQDKEALVQAREKIKYSRKMAAINQANEFDVEVQRCENLLEDLSREIETLDNQIIALDKTADDIEHQNLIEARKKLVKRKGELKIEKYVSEFEAKSFKVKENQKDCHLLGLEEIANQSQTTGLAFFGQFMERIPTVTTGIRPE